MKLTILTIIITIFSQLGCSNNHDYIAHKLQEGIRLTVVNDEQTKSLNIRKLNYVEMLEELINNKGLSPQNKAIIIQRLSEFPNQQTTDTIKSYIDDEDRVGCGFTKTEKDEEEWLISKGFMECQLGNIALDTLDKIKDKRYFNGEEWKYWNKD